jgi:glycosyltransferase involved in cell wall biosynthesis
MPRLLILCEYPTLLGGERSMLATLTFVAAAGFDVHVAAPHDGPLSDALQEASIPHTAWRTHDASGERLPLEQLRTALGELIRRNEPQLIHANSLSTSRISGPVAAQLNVPSIGHLRDIITVSRQAMCDINMHRLVIAVSEATRRFHVEQGLDGGKCVALYNGVDLKTFHPRSPNGHLHRELGLPAHARFIAAIGQLGLRKGTDVTLAAAAGVAGEFPDVHWLVIGERTSNKDESREFEASLRAAASHAPLAGRVHFLGRRDDVAELLPECALLVHAARQEPLGRILLEAAASGLAIVATDVGGTREIFPDGTNSAVLVPPDDSHALGDAIRILLHDDERRRSIGMAARRRAEEAFDIRRAAARLIDTYESVI